MDFDITSFVVWTGICLFLLGIVAGMWIMWLLNRKTDLEQIKHLGISSRGQGRLADGTVVADIEFHGYDQVRTPRTVDPHRWDR